MRKIQNTFLENQFLCSTNVSS